MSARELRIISALLVAVYAWSAWQPAKVGTWWLEVAPVFVGLPLIAWLHARLGLAAITLRLLAFEALVVAIGAHYTYAEVPIGFYALELFGFERNHYDRFAHFMQGVFPTMLLRELLLRTTALRPGAWLFAIVSAFCLSFSAFYEFIEWGAAVLLEEGATDFLGTQGDPWDTQWDMFLAFCGSVVAQLAFSGLLDRQLRRKAQDSDPERR